ncbi:MAG: hypothetical protein ACJ8FU_08540 [Xanthobacteraceae bacterium]
MPPLLEEIALVERRLDAERCKDNPDFVAFRELRERLAELLDWARTNGWGTDPTDPTTPAPAVAAAA